MDGFNGFPEGKSRQVPIPSLFFSELLPLIDHLGELKLTLHVFWRLSQIEGPFRFLRWADLVKDEALADELGTQAGVKPDALREALGQAVRRGTLLEARVTSSQGAEQIYFLNSPKGRAALRAIESGRWRPLEAGADGALEIEEPVNIFQLYEENIGPLAPMIADALTEAEETYPPAWIEEAIGIAVGKNKRNWRYIVAILERWQREGKHGKKEKAKDRPDSEAARRRYVEGEFSDFIEH